MEPIILKLSQEDYWTLSRQKRGPRTRRSLGWGEDEQRSGADTRQSRVERNVVCEDEAEGYASSKARMYRDWAVEMPTEAQRDTARRMADEMEAEYVAAMKGDPAKPEGFVGRGRTNEAERIPGKAGWSGTELVLTRDKLYRAAAMAGSREEETE